MMAPVHVLKQDKAEVEARARALMAKVRLAARKMPIRANFPAASSSASPSPARSPCGRT